MEWLKKILGEDANDELMEVKKGIGENFVPNDTYKKKTDKLEQVESELKTAKDQLKITNDTIKDLQKKAGEYDDLKEDFNKLESDYEEYKKGEDTRLAKIKKKSALEKDLLKAKADENAVDLLLNDFDIDELELDDDGHIKDFDEVLEPVKEKRPTLFGEVEITGDGPTDGGGNGEITDNPFKAGSISLSKQADLLKDNPDTAKRMIKAAGLDPAQYGL